jgi:hypothetical protein
MASLLFQNLPKVHSDAPRRMEVSRMPKTGTVQSMSGPWVVTGNSPDLVLKPFIIANPREDDHHRDAEEVALQVALQKTRTAQQINNMVCDVLHD